MKPTPKPRSAQLETNCQTQQATLRIALGPSLLPRIALWLRHSTIARPVIAGALPLPTAARSVLRMLRAGELQIVLDGPPEDPNSRFSVELTQRGVVKAGGWVQ